MLCPRVERGKGVMEISIQWEEKGFAHAHFVLSCEKIHWNLPHSSKCSLDGLLGAQWTSDAFSAMMK